MSKNVVSRDDARAAGAKRYFTGEPCKNGHLSERSVTTARCLACESGRRRAAYEKDPEKTREYMRKYREENLERERARARLRYKKHADSVRASSRRWREENPERLRAQRGHPEPLRPRPDRCDCCGGPPPHDRGLALDHCHETGEFRGWLCTKCNVAIGGLGDNLHGVLRAVSYLLWHSITQEMGHE